MICERCSKCNKLKPYRLTYGTCYTCAGFPQYEQSFLKSLIELIMKTPTKYMSIILIFSGLAIFVLYVFWARAYFDKGYEGWGVGILFFAVLSFVIGVVAYYQNGSK